MPNTLRRPVCSMFALCALSLVLTAPVNAAPRGGRVVPAARTPPPAGVTIDLRGLPPNEALGRMPVAPDPAMRGLVLAALRRFATGVARPNAVDRAITKAIGRRGDAKTIAKRILARIDAMPPASRLAAFGDAAAIPSSIELTKAASGAGLVFAGIGELATDTLPAEAVPPPASYHFEMSGLTPVELSDGDANGDELVAMSTFVTFAGGAFVVSTKAAPNGPMTGVTTTSPIALDVGLFDGTSSAALVASVVAESDGDSQVTQEDYELMVGLAQGLATQLVTAADNTPALKLGRFAFALDYTVGLLAASTPAKWPAGSLKKTLLSDATSLYSLYSLPSSTDGAAKWKVMHDHDLPSGHYKLYYDVPAPPIVQPNVKVKVTKVVSLDPEADGADLTASLSINGADVNRELPENKSSHTPGWIVQRKLAPNAAAATIGLGLSELDPAPESGFITIGWGTVPCGDSGNGPWDFPCPPLIWTVDINPDPQAGDGWAWSAMTHVLLVVDLATGDISGAVNGKVGETIVLQGDSAGARGRMELVVTVEQ